MDEHGPVFIICRNRRAMAEMKKISLPKGSKVIVDTCALDNYIEKEDIDAMHEVAKAKDQMGVS